MGNNIIFPKINAFKVLWKQEHALATNYLHDSFNFIVYTQGKDYHWERVGLCIVDML